MATTFTPATPGAPEITIEPDLFRGPRVLVGGAALAPSRERGRPTYLIPMADGSERPMTLHGAFLGLRASFEGREYAVERRLTWIELFMVVLPLALITLEPPYGILAAAVGVMVNLLLIRRPWPLPGRLGATAAIVALGFLAVGLLSGQLLG